MATITQADSAAVAGILTEQIASMHDVLKPQAVMELWSRYGDQYYPMFGILGAAGRERPIARDEWFGWEENWYHQNIKTEGDTAEGAAGATVDITLDAAYHDSDGNSYPRVGDIVTLPGSNFDQARIQAKDTTDADAHVLTLKPVKSTVKIPALADGTILSITNGAFAAGTGQPDGAVVGSTKRTFVAQIFKETIGAEGSQLVNEIWYKVTDNNKNVIKWYSPGYAMAEYRLALKIDGAYLWGDETDNITVDAGEKGAGNTVKTTKGIMRHVKELGKSLEYAEGAFSPLDLDDVGLYLKSQGITAGYAMFWLGARMYNDVENGMSDWLGDKSGGTDYTTAIKNIFGGNSDLAVNIGFRMIKKGGVTFSLQPMNAWSNPVTFGASGYNLDKYGLITPLNKFVDPKTKKVLNNIETRYRAYNGYNRKFETWTVGGAGKGKLLTEYDEQNIYLRGHHGLQAFKVNQMIMFIPK